MVGSDLWLLVLLLVAVVHWGGFLFFLQGQLLNHVVYNERGLDKACLFVFVL